MPRPIRWAPVAITTVPQRRKTLLPRTLASLRTAGWSEFVLFVDGIGHEEAVSYEREFGLPVVNRNPRIKTFGNWALALAETYIRNPLCDRYFVAQDDFSCIANLREYLDRCPYPDGKDGKPKGYWNAFTFDFYHRRAPRDLTIRQQRITGWYVSPTQQGLGAVALVFDRESVWDLLSERDHIVTRPAHAGHKAWTNIDGGIVDALSRKRGRKEYVHCPSLVQHLGEQSTMGNRRHPSASSFPGTDFDALTFLEAR